MVPHRGSLVWGIVYERVDFARLDRFEGGYERVVLQVLDDDDLMHDVTTYCVLDKGRYAPSELYVEKMLRWAKRWKFPESYLSQLPTPTRPQPRPR